MIYEGDNLRHQHDIDYSIGSFSFSVDEKSIYWKDGTNKKITVLQLETGQITANIDLEGLKDDQPETFTSKICLMITSKQQIISYDKYGCHWMNMQG